MKTLKQVKPTGKAADNLLVPEAQPESSQTRSVWLALRNRLSVLKRRWNWSRDKMRAGSMPHIRIAAAAPLAMSAVPTTFGSWPECAIWKLLRLTRNVVLAAVLGTGGEDAAITRRRGRLRYGPRPTGSRVQCATYFRRNLMGLSASGFADRFLKPNN